MSNSMYCLLHCVLSVHAWHAAVLPSQLLLHHVVYGSA
jgi:hypothetical protein